MWDRYIQDLRMKLEETVPHRCYWFVLENAIFTMCIKGYIFEVKLPLPKVLGTAKWKDEWKYKEHNEKEIERARRIWSELIAQLKDKLQRIEAGESNVMQEFKDGILFEDGQYGLRYEGRIRSKR